jgi:toxin ParE1/3/4
MIIEWTEHALDDVEEIKRYIRRDSSFYALRLAQKIVAAAESLEHFPSRGRAIPGGSDPSVREILMQSYRIIYVIRHDRIKIVAVLHSARNLDLIDPKPWQEP